MRNQTHTLKPIHIAFVITSLRAGGAERVISILATNFVNMGFAVTLITFDHEAVDFYEIPAGINRIKLNLESISSSVLIGLIHRIRRIYYLRKTIIKSKVSIVISFTTVINILSLISCFGTKIPVIVSERTNPKSKKLNKTDNLLRKLLYRFSSTLVIQTNGVAEFYHSMIDSKKIAVVPNPIEETIPLPEVVNRQKVIGAMGRLVRSKGFDTLLQAFAICVKVFPEWKLRILGQGPEKENLIELAHQLRIVDKVEFLGLISNPGDQLLKMSIFVLSSRFEGFPNALAEAMSCGLPVIATDCDYGPREMFVDESEGYLVSVDDVDALAKKMILLMSDSELRSNMGNNAKIGVQRFSVHEVMRQWGTIIQNALKINHYEEGSN